MALFNPDPAKIGAAIGKTAGARAAQKVAQSMSPKLVRDVQRVLSVGSTIGNLLGMSTGIGAIDGLLSLSGGSREAATPLLGGLTLSQAQRIHEQLRAARVSLKNLFFIRITDPNPPEGSYPGGTLGDSLGVSKIGPAMGAVSSGISGAVGALAGAALSSAAGAFMGGLGLSSGAAGGANSIGQIAVDSFDLLALDVSYGASLVSDHQQIGGSFIDRPTGMEPQELQLVTMDDEVGSIKRWFDGKREQVVHSDGTFGLPSEYLLNIEIVHAVPSEEVPTADLAYSKTLRLRPQSISIEHSRRDQGVAELQLSFAQFDGFMGV